MAYFLSKLDNIILTTMKSIISVCCSIAAIVHFTYNAFHSSEEELKGENKLLKACVRQLENKITFLTGRIVPSTTSISPLKMRTISLNEEKDPDQQDSWILVEPKNKRKSNQIGKVWLEDLRTSDPLEIRPIITQITKEVQERLTGLSPEECPPLPLPHHSTCDCPPVDSHWTYGSVTTV